MRHCVTQTTPGWGQGGKDGWMNDRLIDIHSYTHIHIIIHLQPYTCSMCTHTNMQCKHKHAVHTQTCSANTNIQCKHKHAVHTQTCSANTNMQCTHKHAVRVHVHTHPRTHTLTNTHGHIHPHTDTHTRTRTQLMDILKLKQPSVITTKQTPSVTA